jgi:hypothetical protein
LFLAGVKTLPRSVLWMGFVPFEAIAPCTENYFYSI